MVLYFFPALSWIDGIVGLLIGLYIIYEAYLLIKQGIDLLLDKVLDEHDEVKDVIDTYLNRLDFNSYHCLKTRAGGSKDKFVEFHFVMNPKTTIEDAHNLGDKIEDEIKRIEPNAFWHIVYHVDPYDDSISDLCR